MVKRVAHRTWNPPFKITAEEPPRSPPHYYDPEVNREEVLQNSELSLEKKFCLLVGIPWYKVLAAQKYIYCHENVLKWDDSGAKDALFDAHERFCSMINNLPCEHPLPDPDMYIDNIDWNMEIDPDLIADMEKENRNHDKKEYLSDNKILGCVDKNRNTVDNPLETHRLEDNVDVKDSAQGWNKCGDLLESENACNESTKGLNAARESTKYKSDCVKSWNQGALLSESMNGKGLGDALKNPGGANCWNSKPNELSNQNNHIGKIGSGVHSRDCRKREEYQENTRSRKGQKREGPQFRGEGRPQTQYNLRSSKY